MSEQTNAHDPLHEDGHADHQAHRAAQRNAQPKIDLRRIRSLVIAFRQTGDDRNLDAAWTALEPALQGSTIDAETLVVAAFVAQSRHEFEYAASLLDRALAANRRNDEAWLLKASIHLVQGDAGKAIDACKQLREVPVLVLITCQGRVAVVSGDFRSALTRLSGVLAVAEKQATPPDIHAWSLSVAGDLAKAIGNRQQARLFYQRSLVLSERTQVRAALVDVLLEQSEYQSAFVAVPSTTTALPLLVRRLIAAKRLNRFDEVADVSVQIATEFEKWIADEDWLHAREMARFYIDVVERPALARHLAEVNIMLQREPEDVRLYERTQAVRS